MKLHLFALLALMIGSSAFASNVFIIPCIDQDNTIQDYVQVTKKEGLLAFTSDAKCNEMGLRALSTRFVVVKDKKFKEFVSQKGNDMKSLYFETKGSQFQRNTNRKLRPVREYCTQGDRAAIQFGLPPFDEDCIL